MNFEFHIIDANSLRNITDEQSFSQEIFNCLGSTILVFNEIVIRDEFEVIFRIAEVLSALDLMLSPDIAEGEARDILFQFEYRLFFSKQRNNLSITDRQSASEIDQLTVTEAADLRERLIDFVLKEIASISPYAADRLLSRRVLN